MARENKIIFLIATLSIFTSLVYSFYFQIQPLVDAKAYDQIGWNLTSGFGYRAYLDERPLSEDPAIGRVGPGYEFFLAGIYKILGHNIKAVWAIQAVLRGVSVLLLYSICRKIFGLEAGSKIGIFSGLIFGLYPDLIESSAMIMAETFAIFLAVLVVYLFFKFYQSPNWKNLIVFSLIFPLTVLVRSPLGLMIFVFAGTFIYQKKIKELIVFILIFIAVLSPWIVRNYFVYQKFIPLNAAAGYDLWTGNHPLATGELINIEEIDKYTIEHGILATNNYGIKKTAEFIIANPLQFIWLLFRKATIYFSVLRPTGFWFYFGDMQKAATIVASAAFSIVLFIFGLAGIFYSLKEKNTLLKILLLLTLMAPLAILPIVIETRYRYQIYPFLAVFAGFFVYKFLQKESERYRFLFIAASIVFAIAVFDGVMSFERIKERIDLII